jgi:serine phosphatase RsbU (regulator of sigma subunit)
VKTRRSFFQIPASFVITAFLAVAVVVAVQGAFSTRASLARTFAGQADIVRAQLALEEMRRLQIDAESSVRGYSLTRDPFYRQQYANVEAQFDSRAAAVRATMTAAGLSGAVRSLDDYISLQENWRSKIAGPLLANPGRDIAAIDKRNKAFTDFENRSVALVQGSLADANDRLARTAQEQVNANAYSRAFWLIVLGLLAILLNGFRSRLVTELEEERTTTETLQKAFRSEAVPLPNCEVGSAYLAASSHLAVGGDVFDVYRLSDTLALIFIADVSGKGVDAAVLTAFIKFTIRGIALRRRDPGAMLAEFNTAFSQTVENPYLFVSMFVGILDCETLQLRYASAGHDSAYIRRSTGMTSPLAVTGPVLGVMEEPFETKTLHLEDLDTLVLTTDGLTEARDRNGVQLQEAGAVKLIGASNPQPQLLADEVVTRVRALGGNELRDDLAVLVIRVHEPEADDARE